MMMCLLVCSFFFFFFREWIQAKGCGVVGAAPEEARHVNQAIAKQEHQQQHAPGVGGGNGDILDVRRGQMRAEHKIQKQRHEDHNQRQIEDAVFLPSQANKGGKRRKKREKRKGEKEKSGKRKEKQTNKQRKQIKKGSLKQGFGRAFRLP